MHFMKSSYVYLHQVVPSYRKPISRPHTVLRRFLFIALFHFIVWQNVLLQRLSSISLQFSAPFHGLRKKYYSGNTFELNSYNISSSGEHLFVILSIEEVVSFFAVHPALFVLSAFCAASCIPSRTLMLFFLFTKGFWPRRNLYSLPVATLLFKIFFWLFQHFAIFLPPSNFQGRSTTLLSTFEEWFSHSEWYYQSNWILAINSSPW